MRIILIVVLLMAAVSAFAATSQTVSYPSGGDTVQAVMYTPAGKGPFPALVVIHEWWGLNDWVKEQASKLAGEGYVTLAVDLYRGQVATTRDEAHELSRGLPRDRAQRDLLAAVEFLGKSKSVNSRRIGVIGWCMGGGYALDVAIAAPHLAAAVVNYGRLATDSDTLKKIHAPVLGIFGAMDRGIPPADVQRFQQQMKELGKRVEVTIFPDAGHAFENPNNQAGYRATDAAKAWELTLDFLRRTLLAGKKK
jgi:carboxymethylenebutenolidase